MTRTRSIAFRLCAVLMVCALLFVCSPIQAEALGLEVAVFAIPVIAGIIIGIGVLNDPYASQAFTGLVNSCFNALQATGEWIVDGDKVELRTQMIDGYQQYYADVELVEAVRQWLFDNDVIQADDSFKRGTGTTLVYSDNLSSSAMAYWKSIDIYSIASVAKSGQVLMLSAGSSSLPSIACGLVALSSSLGFRVLQVDTVSNFSLKPYSSADFPVGEFVSLNSYTAAGTSYYNDELNNQFYAETIFLCFEDALKAYQSSVIDLDYYHYLTPESYFIPTTTKAASTGQAILTVSSIANLGYISSGGIVGSRTVNLTPGKGYNSYRYVFAALDDSVVTTYSSTIGTTGYIADPDLPLSVGYADWMANSLVIDGATHVAVGFSPPSLDATSDLKQEDVWSGQVWPDVPSVDFTGHIPFVSYTVGATPSPLFARASSADGGYLTYQWYCDGLPMEYERTAMLYPRTTEAGEHTYSCLIGNFTESASLLGSYAWSPTTTVVVTAVESVPDVTVPSVTESLEGAADAEAIQGAISDSMTDFGTLTDSLADAAVPDYSGLDLGISKIFGNADDPGSGIALVAKAFQGIFVSDSYIFWVFFFSFLLACVSFVIFGKRS